MQGKANSGKILEKEEKKKRLSDRAVAVRVDQRR